MQRILIAVTSLVILPPAAHAQVDAALLAGMQARSIGPAGMSGRVASVDVVVAGPNIVYVGSATGGLWKSVDGALTWKPVFDGQGASSIGAVAVFQANPDTHGRGVFILDDVRPLRALAGSPALREATVHLFEPPTAIQHEVPDAIGYRSTGHAMFVGENRPHGALLTYWLATGNDSAEVDIQQWAMALAEETLEVALQRLNRVFAEDHAAFRQHVAAAGVELVSVPDPITLDWRKP